MGYSSGQQTGPIRGRKHFVGPESEQQTLLFEREKMVGRMQGKEADGDVGTETLGGGNE